MPETQLIYSTKKDKKMKNDIVQKIASILAEQLNKTTEEILPEADIRDDLGADSLDVVEIVLNLEEEFDLEIPDEDSEGIRTAGDIVAYVNTALAREKEPT